MRLHEAALALNARAIGPDVEFGAVASDSRNLLAGALFVALRGERFDGHRFAAQALAQGAAAVMVDSQANLDLAPAIIVPDTRLALGQLAAWQRRRMPAKVLAITGSNGKTTVKEMLAAILKRSAGESAVLATVGNLNNDIGMPLTLLRLTPEHRYAVLEMGMNHPGELSYLSRLAQPDAALVNNALRAHLAGLGSVEAVAKAKAEIYAGLKADGVALVNADDPHAALLRALAGSHRCVDFGLAQGDIRADYQLHDFASDMTLHTPAGAVELTLNVPGLQRLQCPGRCRHGPRRGRVAVRHWARFGGLHRRQGPAPAPCLHPGREADRRQLQRQSGFGCRRDRGTCGAAGQTHPGTR